MPISLLTPHFPGNMREFNLRARRDSNERSIKGRKARLRGAANVDILSEIAADASSATNEPVDPADGTDRR